jgi:hypothetical protein
MADSIMPLVNRLRLCATYGGGVDIIERLRSQEYHQALQREALELAAQEIERLTARVAELEAAKPATA